MSAPCPNCSLQAVAATTALLRMQAAEAARADMYGRLLIAEESLQTMDTYFQSALAEEQTLVNKVTDLTSKLTKKTNDIVTKDEVKSMIATAVATSNAELAQKLTATFEQRLSAKEKDSQKLQERVDYLENVLLRKLIYSARIDIVRSTEEHATLEGRHALAKFSDNINFPKNLSKRAKAIVTSDHRRAGSAHHVANQIAHDLDESDITDLARLVCEQKRHRSAWMELFSFVLKLDPLTIYIDQDCVNCAMLFIKPHANTVQTQLLLSTTLLSKGIKIVQEGEFTGEQIDAGMHIDQHYRAIASKATLLQPREVSVAAAKFEDKFGLSWETALADGLVFNALDACKELGVDAEGLNKIWNGAHQVKLGSGLYCALMEHEGKKIYTFNAFFMSMRSKFVTPGTSIHYYVVEFSPKDMSWADFRNEVIGSTDPCEADEGSLRSLIHECWDDLGLEYEPNICNNSVGASASPFEGLAERLNWLKADIETDIFGAKCLAAGIPAATLKEWSVDPQVKGKSIFAQLKDTNTSKCLARMVELAK